jgi:adenylyl-sulfate kinase
LTGLPGAGKSTIAGQLAIDLRQRELKAEILDGDAIRQEISSDLGFTRQDRREQVRRVVYLCKLLSRNGIVCIVSIIAPFRDLREYARQEISKESRFIEVFVKCSLDGCIKRDPKGLYKKALAGEIRDFTGLDAPYEEPTDPDIVVETEKDTVEACVRKIILAANSRRESVNA